MPVGDLINSILIGVLIIITAFYAYQTRRQANLLNEQLEQVQAARLLDRKNTALSEASRWAAEATAFLVSEFSGDRVPEIDEINTRISELYTDIQTILGFTDIFGSELQQVILECSRGIADIVTAKEKIWANPDERLDEVVIKLSDNLSEMLELSASERRALITGKDDSSSA